MATYRVDLLHSQLIKAGLLILSVDEFGTIVFIEEPTPEQINLANQVLANHNPDERVKHETAHLDIESLPNWATWTPAQARDYVKTNVLNGQTIAQVEAWIDANVSTIAQARTALKLIATNIIALREILSVVAQAVLLLRDIVLKRIV